MSWTRQGSSTQAPDPAQRPNRAPLVVWHGASVATKRSGEDNGRRNKVVVDTAARRSQPLLDRGRPCTCEPAAGRDGGNKARHDRRHLRHLHWRGPWRVTGRSRGQCSQATAIQLPSLRDSAGTADFPKVSCKQLLRPHLSVHGSHDLSHLRMSRCELFLETGPLLLQLLHPQGLPMRLPDGHGEGRQAHAPGGLVVARASGQVRTRVLLLGACHALSPAEKTGMQNS
mmetsp:Transcript_11452/g.26944  ORF Transcript_11452/g.26944 Transcript_11452/m.26944 type:complete len:228 (+) Transcript_11452:122-805(+)